MTDPGKTSTYQSFRRCFQIATHHPPAHGMYELRYFPRHPHRTCLQENRRCSPLDRKGKRLLNTQKANWSKNNQQRKSPCFDPCAAPEDSSSAPHRLLSLINEIHQADDAMIVTINKPQTAPRAPQLRAPTITNGTRTITTRILI